jgi:hypothetical protein
MLRNHKTNGFMVLDIDDKNINYNAAFAVTTSPLMTFACPRSMFKFEKYDSIKLKMIKNKNKINFIT